MSDTNKRDEIVARAFNVAIEYALEPGQRVPVTRFEVWHAQSGRDAMARAHEYVRRHDDVSEVTVSAWQSHIRTGRAGRNV